VASAPRTASTSRSIGGTYAKAAKFGEVIPDLSLVVPFSNSDGFNWVGYGLPGDSGSRVMDDAGIAVGDLTHGIGVAGVPVPGLNFGTDMNEIFKLIGSSYKLVPGRRGKHRPSEAETARNLARV
jgi:hypothetical protein